MTPFISQVIKEIENKYPEINVYTDGLKIHTTLDKNAQDYVDQMMYKMKLSLFLTKIPSRYYPIDTKTGEIRALGGTEIRKLILD